MPTENSLPSCCQALSWYKCIAARCKCSPCIEKNIKILNDTAYRRYSSFIQVLVSESLLRFSYFLLFQDIEMSLTQRQDMHIYIRTTNLEKMQNNLERAELCLLFKFPIVLYFLNSYLTFLWVKCFWKEHLLMCSIYLFMAWYILKIASVLDLENVVRLFYGHFTCFGRHILSKYFNFDWRKRRKDEKRKPTKVFIVYSFLFIILFTRLSNSISVNHTSSDNWFLYWWVLFL